MSSGTNGVLVAVIDTGLKVKELTRRVGEDAANKYLYKNSSEIAGDRIDNDGNGFVDDYTGIRSGNADNDYHLSGTSGHGTVVTHRIIERVVEAQKNAPETDLNVSVMQGNYTSYFSDTIKAIQYGAKIVNLSLGLKPGHRPALDYIANVAKEHDALVVIWNYARGRGDSDIGQFETSDHIIELGFLENNKAYSASEVDLIAAKYTNSYGIATATGDLAAIWAANPELSSQQVLEAVRETTKADEGDVAKDAELGGVIDRDAAIKYVLDSLSAEDDANSDENGSGKDDQDKVADGEDSDANIPDPAGDQGGEQEPEQDVNVLYGTEDNDMFRYAVKFDVAHGYAGNDHIRGAEKAFGGSGHDNLYTKTRTGGELYGEDGDDRLIGYAGDDYLVGGEGADVLKGAHGNDVLVIDGDDTWVQGGTGFDQAIVNSADTIDIDDVFFHGIDVLDVLNEYANTVNISFLDIRASDDDTLIIEADASDVINIDYNLGHMVKDTATIDGKNYDHYNVSAGKWLDVDLYVSQDAETNIV